MTYEPVFERYKSLMDHNPDPVYTFDVRGRIIDINSAGERFLGSHREEIIGRPFQTLLTVEFRDEVTERFLQSMHGNPQSCECQMARMNGKTSWLDFKFIPIVVDGNVEGVFGVGKDITAQREREQRLGTLNHWFGHLVEVAPIGLVISQNDRIVYANHKAIDIMHAPHKFALIGRDVYDFVDPKYHKSSKERMSEPTVGKALPLFRVELIRCNGENAFVDIASQHIMYEDDIATMNLLLDVTDRVHKEHAVEHLARQLVESEAQYRLIADHSDNMIGLLDSKGVFQYVSPSHEPILGVSASEWAGRSVFQYVHPDDITIVEQQFASIVTLRLDMDAQWRYRKANGDYIWVEAHGKPIVDDENKVYRVLLVTRDISERRDYIERLRKSEEMYRLISENSMDLISMIDKKGTITYASPSYEKVLGRRSAGYEGHKWLDFVDQTEVPMMIEKYDELLESMKPVTAIYHGQHVNGSLIPVEADIIPIVAEDGGLSILCVAQDIRDRIQSQKKLKESEERYSLIAKNTSDIIRIVNTDGIVTYASPSHEAVLQTDWHEFLGKSYLIGVHPNDQLSVKDSFESVFKMRQAFICEYRRQHQDGRYLWMETTGTPIFDERQNVTGIVAVCRNVTERKQYEEQLEHLALHDALTGLPNRRLFSERTKMAIKHADRNQSMLAVLLLDCDGFKNINDTYGHDAGDEVIKEFALRIAGSIRESDTVARMGGDEFIVLLPEVNTKEDVLEVVNRILQSVRPTWHIGEHAFHLTASVGISAYPSDAVDDKMLVKRADEALYESKRSGKNTFRWYKGDGEE